MSDTRRLRLTDAAAKRIQQLQQKNDQPDAMLRVTVSGGGCSGFQNAFKLDDSKTDDDITFAHNGVTIVTDDASLDLLDQSEIDFVDDLMGSMFKVNNPNAESMCGCGTSFSIKF